MPFQFLHGHVLIRNDGSLERPFLLEVSPEGIFCYPLDSDFVPTSELPPLAEHLRNRLIDRGSPIYDGGNSDSELRAIFLGASRSGVAPVAGYEILAVSNPAFADVTSAWDVRLYRGRTKINDLELTLRLFQDPWSIYLPMPHIVFGGNSPLKSEYIRRYPRLPRNDSEVPACLFQILPIYAVAQIVVSAAATRYGLGIKAENLPELDKIVRAHLQLTTSEARTIFRGARRLKFFAFSALRTIAQWRPFSKAVSSAMLKQSDVYERLHEESSELGTNIFNTSLAILKYLNVTPGQVITPESEARSATFRQRIDLIAKAVRDEVT
jgi:hypothetical protein